MISKELRKKIFLKYNIEESNINRPIHYKIPDNIGVNYYLINNNLDEQRLNKKISKILKNKTNYTINKENNIKKIKNRILNNKIDILFNKTYDTINNKIIIYPNYYIQKRKCDKILVFSKGKMKDDIAKKSNVYNFLFKKKIYRNRDNYFLDKQYTWSKELLDQKKLKNYEALYKIKYIDTIPSFHNKIYENHKYIRDRTIPKIIKINSNSKKYILFNKKRNTIHNNNFFPDENESKFNSISNFKYNKNISPIQNNKKSGNT